MLQSIKHLYMRHHIILAAAILLFTITLYALPAFAHSGKNGLPQNVSFKPVPSWVNTQSYDPKAFEGEAVDGSAYLLVSNQRRLTGQDDDLYIRLVQRLPTQDAVEDESQFSVDFDPSYETLKLHHLRVIRDGVVQHRLKTPELKPEFLQVNVETETEKLIYNGTVRVISLLEDIRVGDIIDYAYTRSGALPVFKGHISDWRRLGYGTRVAHLHQARLVPSGRNYTVKSHGDGPEPKISKQGGMTHYSWDLYDVDRIDPESNRPNWHLAYPYHQLTSFASWEEVGALMAPHYAPPPQNSEALNTVIKTLKTENKTDAQRLRAALRFAQAEIRYLGIEMGDGGYVPRPPSKVLSRRFGDCKDKTLLLITLLDAMGIQAHGALVNTDSHGGFTTRLPNPYAFDHVIVRAVLDGKTYYLDPTRGDQLGTLDTLAQSHYEKALIIAPDGPGVVDMPKYDENKWAKTIFEDFDINTDDKSIHYTLTYDYTGESADGLKSWYDKKGPELATQEDLESLEDDYPGIEVRAPIEFEVFEDEARAVLKEHYIIKDAWEFDESGDVYTFDLTPWNVSNVSPDTETADRDAPYYINPKRARKHVITFKANSDWSLTADNQNFEHDAFSLTRNEVFDKDDYVFTSTYTYRAKADHIAPGVFPAVMKDVKAYNDIVVTTLQSPDQPGTGKIGSNDDDLTYAWIQIAFYLLLIPIGLFAYWQSKRKGPQSGPSQNVYLTRNGPYATSRAKDVSGDGPPN